jgi:glycosyltransferase involved in cell wall biosynthesis
MKIAILSTSDSVGGAAIAAFRLCEALQAAGHAPTMLVKDQKTTAEFVDNSAYRSRLQKAVGFAHFVAERLSFLPHERDKSVRFMFSLANFGKDLSHLAAIQQADAINIHWINQGFLSLRSIELLAKLGKPVFLTLHDMWAFTGGCHYADTCEGFMKQCGSCPLVARPKANDISHKVWLRKQALFAKIDFQVITPSRWLKEIAEKSTLFAGKTIHVLPNSIDTQVFAPIAAAERQALRQKYNIKGDKNLIFFFAMNLAHERKGFPQLLEALQYCIKENPAWAERNALLIAGKADPKTLESLPCEVHYLGFLSGVAQVSAAYHLADLFVTPSLEDNLPNTIMESLACGTPVVAFATGGIPEMVEHLQNGYIAHYRDAADLAKGLNYVLADSERLENMRIAARAKAVTAYDYSQIAPQVVALLAARIGNTD